MITALKCLFEPDSKTSELIELAVPTISTNLCTTGTNPPFCVSQLEVAEGLSMSTRNDWTGYLGQDWTSRTGLAQAGPIRMKETEVSCRRFETR